METVLPSRNTSASFCLQEFRCFVYSDHPVYFTQCLKGETARVSKTRRQLSFPSHSPRCALLPDSLVKSTGIPGNRKNRLRPLRQQGPGAGRTGRTDTDRNGHELIKKASSGFDSTVQLHGATNARSKTWPISWCTNRLTGSSHSF
ncbi:hypothetical protein PoB_005713500 [Plakobranchus ocellatus]|uniref:Uncharacterized protein n=1 Tax=Plakobranchus ocellatus TaxID=259542 RepID=A0AAV4CGI5_9GAST|nr:hypothetical protein PoB_005713500 [Plakobranchus ocellatus]